MVIVWNETYQNDKPDVPIVCLHYEGLWSKPVWMFLWIISKCMRLRCYQIDFYSISIHLLSFGNAHKIESIFKILEIRSIKSPDLRPPPYKKGDLSLRKSQDANLDFAHFKRNVCCGRPAKAGLVRGFGLD